MNTRLANAGLACLVVGLVLWLAWGCLFYTGCARDISGPGEARHCDGGVPQAESERLAGGGETWDGTGSDQVPESGTRHEEEWEYEDQIEEDGVSIDAKGYILDETVPGGLPTLFFCALTRASQPIFFLDVSATATWRPYGGGSWSPLWSDRDFGFWVSEVSVDAQFSKKMAWTGHLEGAHGWQLRQYGVPQYVYGQCERTAFFLEEKIGW
ncbi:MAG: hypothetical protein ONB30_10275 [candidate division KSB1 bacterium]|nr:hypothetical protein [candidate division KSB1 bacterium]